MVLVGTCSPQHVGRLHSTCLLSSTACFRDQRRRAFVRHQSENGSRRNGWQTCERFQQSAATTQQQPAPDTPAELTAEDKHAGRQRESDIFDVDRPRWHIMAPRGWVNDPNAPLLHDGTYHLFFQHLPDTTDWEFGLTWGHVASSDLVHWAWLPVALSPSPGGYDADGCFSGSALVNADGAPTILYTGVRLRNNPDAPPLPDKEYDIGLPFIETQLCAAHADPCSDPLLKSWSKDDSTSIPLPPKDLHPVNELMGWRDPFIFEMPSEDNGHEYGMLLGNGIKDRGGVVLVYRSKDLTSGWRYAGTLCEGDKSDGSGTMWECPILLPLQPDAGMSDGWPDAIIGSMDTCHAQDYTHVLFVSPDAPSMPVLYYLGRYADGEFDLKEADGPFRLDLGDAPYAPNTLVNSDGRHLMWMWIQEHSSRNDDDYNYSGCMSCPRELHIRHGRLVQRPLQELATLRGQQLFAQRDAVRLEDGSFWAIPAASHTSLDVTFQLHPGDASITGLAILDDCISGTSNDACNPLRAAVVYDWGSDQLEVRHNTLQLNADQTQCRLTGKGECDQGAEVEDRQKARRVGGTLGWCKQEPLRVRLLLDGSCLEVFAGLSDDDVARGVLSTRIYRGKCSQPGLGFFAVGGSAQVSNVNIWEMEQCWSDREAMETEAAKPCAKSDKQVRPAEKAVDMEYGSVRAGRCKKCLGLHRPGECPLLKDGDEGVVHPYGEGNA